jgi:hypothetical protein
MDKTWGELRNAYNILVRKPNEKRRKERRREWLGDVALKVS